MPERLLNGGGMKNRVHQSANGRLTDLLGGTANLCIRTGDTARFIARVECCQALRVGSREGMVFPAYRMTAGLLLPAELSDAELAEVYAEERYTARPAECRDLAALRAELARIRRSGFAVNSESEHGLVAALSAASRSLEASLGGQDHAREPEEGTR
jgi:DNA-binding IclR family transcriptional regulator